MKNIYEVIRQKETDIERLKKEVQALLTVVPMLEDETPVEVQPVPLPVPGAIETQAKPVATVPPARPVWP